MINASAIKFLRDPRGHEHKNKAWLVRLRQVEENQKLHTATSAKPVTIEPDRTMEGGLVVKFEVPMAWRRDAAEPGTAKVILQVHLDESCHRKRWFATDFADNNRMSECSDLCEEIRGDGNMTEAVLSMRGSDQEFFAILGNSNDNKSIPLVSLGSAIPYQGPVDSRPGSPHASPAASTPLKRRLDPPESRKKRVKAEHDSSDEDDD
ncbi:hypothetical protein B0T11DRAFT_74070 [Plectosphaerella cucumerina]|uniref:Uncharacterized protein n=1 Tax=Plectosphaerella cucumerina TaxID=40658 RepID=A0A8K0TEP1_9PEZI|nr:hypothetical protein B0T11DRAFT_74070 [Plectosphaerella cucumerina]